MTPSDFARIGQVLYGPCWQRPLAAALEVNERTVRRWVAGTSPIPDGLPADLMRLLGQRSAEVGRALAGLSRG